MARRKKKEEKESGKKEEEKVDAVTQPSTFGVLLESILKVLFVGGVVYFFIYAVLVRGYRYEKVDRPTVDNWIVVAVGGTVVLFGLLELWRIWNQDPNNSSAARLESSFRALERKLPSLKEVESLKIANGRIATLSAYQEALGDEYARVLLLAETLQSELDKSNTRISDQASVHEAALAAANAATQAEVSQLSGDHATQVQDLRATIADLQNQLTSAVAMNAEHQADLFTARNFAVNLAHQVAVLRSEHQCAEDKYLALLMKSAELIEQMAAEMDADSRKLAATEDKLATATSQLVYLQSEVTCRSEADAELRRQIQVQRSMVALLTDQRDDLFDRKIVMSSKVRTLGQSHNELEQVIASLRGELRTLQSSKTLTQPAKGKASVQRLSAQDTAGECRRCAEQAESIRQLRQKLAFTQDRVSSLLPSVGGMVKEFAPSADLDDANLVLVAGRTILSTLQRELQAIVG